MRKVFAKRAINPGSITEGASPPIGGRAVLSPARWPLRGEDQAYS